MIDIAIYGYSLLTILLFIAALKINKVLKSSILNPFILSLIFIVATLLVSKISFTEYYQGNQPLNSLLGVSVVALAIPLYEQLPQIRKHWKKISIIVIAATLSTMLSGVFLAMLFGASKDIIASILPKSVTTPIAISIAAEIGGNSSLSAVAVSIAGITGSAFGITILSKLKVTNTRAIGLSMGAVSHALGTARSMEYSVKAGSYSSVSMVLCGLLSSLFAPLIFKLISPFFF
ncbi:CidB/LrgB family autolysis modulator [Pasteurellaceae bacterium 15-036681]|nr:CidB/LrgB family autolysis modulator [Pasteurellaceae bacterium 15-036681]